MSSEGPVVAVDVGGTFTDCVAWVDGSLHVAKLSTSSDQSDAVIEGAERLLAGQRASALLHGSTVATNALLEHTGARVVLVTDHGFEDVIEIGRQDRPSLYDTMVDRSPALVERDNRVGVGESLDGLAATVAAAAPDAVAVSLAYSYRDPASEDEVAGVLADLGVPVSLSSRVVGEFREFERTSTTVLNAYLGPAVSGYLDRLAERSETVAAALRVMRSSGGLMEAGEASRLASALLVSGPAGGVVAASALGTAHGYDSMITFDMGGTSTDVCRIDNGRPEVSYERSVDGYVCRMPSVAVHTVGAGGGSVAWRDPGGSLRVGPHSAGAEPGPAAYGRGGTDVTVTDAHVVLGRIDPHGSLSGSLTLDGGAALNALSRLGESFGLDPYAAAAGVLEVVEAHMERAIRAVSIEEGVDPRQATLVAFGGAGGLHAVSLARKLGMRRVAVPPHGGVFSALGLLLAPPRHDLAHSSLIGPDSDALSEAVRAVTSRVSGEYRSAHGTAPVTVEARADMRYVGQAHEVSIPLVEGELFDVVAQRFHATHREINGFSRPDDPVEVVTVRAVAEGTPVMSWSDLPLVPLREVPIPRRRSVLVAGTADEVDVWWRPDLGAGMELSGPSVIEEPVGTTFLGPGERATVLDDGTIEVSW